MPAGCSLQCDEHKRHLVRLLVSSLVTFVQDVQLCACRFKCRQGQQHSNLGFKVVQPGGCPGADVSMFVDRCFSSQPANKIRC